MASTLLNCSICPKHPTFSDTSHLLTHVSSKGHLSHLHRLQVRSQQEISASNQLAAYDQWYSHHDLGRLLSERMLQKEAKISKGRRKFPRSPRLIKKEQASGTRNAISGNQFLTIDPGLYRTPATRVAKTRVSGGNPFRVDEDSDFDSSPVKKHTRRKAHRDIPSFVKRSASDHELNGSEADCPAEVDPAILDTPENSKLKGVLWPGMNLFDAATADMRRRRNQKKDGTALVQMERTSRIVQPTEVIFSDGWTSIKRRPITGMVEDTSPLKGESPVPKKPIRRSRTALQEISANVPRKAPWLVKSTQTYATNGRRRTTKVVEKALPPLPSSSTSTSYAAKSRFSPTEDENLEFKLTVGHLANKRKGGNFTIFHDDDIHQKPCSAPQHLQSTYPQFAPPQVQTELPQTRSHIPFKTAPWIQPQYQPPISYQNLYMTQRQEQSNYYTHQHAGPGKESVEAWFARTGPADQHANPLGWNQSATLVPNPYRTYDEFEYDGLTAFSGLSSHDDVFGYSTNPLSAAYHHLQEHAESPFKTSETSQQLPSYSCVKNDVSISPDGIN